MAEPIDQPDPKALRTLWVLVGLAIGTTLIAALAGLILWVGDVEAGSDLESALGFTAAISGLATALFWGGSAIYAQVRGLWNYAPTWVRVAAWVVIAAVVILAILRPDT